jgi:hypothetical protein
LLALSVRDEWAFFLLNLRPDVFQSDIVIIHEAVGLKRNSKLGALIKLALNVDRSSHVFDEIFANAKPETHAVFVLLGTLLHFREIDEKLVLVLL